MLSTNLTLRPGEDIPANTGCEPDPRLSALGIAHDDLDAVVAALLESGRCDDLLLTRLKKRKLRIKDEIAAMQAHHQPAAVSQAS
jgi:hypothetical protein